MDQLLGFALNALGHFIQDVGCYRDLDAATADLQYRYLRFRWFHSPLLALIAFVSPPPLLLDQ